MTTSQDILNDVDLRYRNTFSTSQKLVWFNEEQRELFDVLELGSAPYSFYTVAGQNFYPFPSEFDYTKINVVTMQLDTSSKDNPEFFEVSMKRNDDNVYEDIQNIWYTIVNNNMFINYPDGIPDNLLVYIYVDAEPTDVTTSTLNIAPDLPSKYHEVLKLGILKRIAMARKDVLMYDNYNADYQEKIADVIFQRHVQEPEFIKPTTNLPRRNHWQYRYIVNGW